MPPFGMPAKATLRIERRGGLAGLKPSAEHALDSLSKAERSALENLLHAPAPAAAAAPTRGMPIPADQYTYRITLTAADGSAQARDVPETALPGALHRLSPRPTP